MRNIEVQKLKPSNELNRKPNKMYAEITLETKILKDVPEKRFSLKVQLKLDKVIS
jgi:hypothetical protein